MQQGNSQREYKNTTRRKMKSYIVEHFFMDEYKNIIQRKTQHKKNTINFF